MSMKALFVANLDLSETEGIYKKLMPKLRQSERLLAVVIS